MRRALDRTFRWVTTGCAVLACSLLLGIAATILWRGLPALDWRLLSGNQPGGGLLYQTLGTLLLVVTAFAVSAPWATGLALTQAIYLPNDGARRRFRLALYGLNGVPSILFGIFGLMLFVKLWGWGKSWLAGGVLLGVMILPTVTVALIERIDAIPRKYLTQAAGLGLSRSQIVRSVILRQSQGGLLSGSLLGLARAAGETAPIMFTAAVFAGATLPDGVKDNPVLALPYHIFVTAQDSLNPAAGAQLWAAAFLLLALVLLFSLLALPVRLAAHEEAAHG